MIARRTTIEVIQLSLPREYAKKLEHVLKQFESVAAAGHLGTGTTIDDDILLASQIRLAIARVTS